MTVAQEYGQLLCGALWRVTRVFWCTVNVCVFGRLLHGCLQRVLNAAARDVSGTHKFDRGLTHLLHSELHWLDVPQRIQFKLGVTVHRCLRANAPQYLVDCCKSTTDAVSRQRLRSASRRQLIVPRHRPTNFGRRAFTVAGPTAYRTRCQTISVIRRLAKTLLGDY